MICGLFWLLAAATSFEVKVIGEMRRMFTARDIGPNVSLSEVNQSPHLYALGPLAGLAGEVTVSDGQVYVSRAAGKKPVVGIEPQVKSVFLVYTQVPEWRSVDLPANVRSESELAEFIETHVAKDTRSPFLVRGTVRTARYHIQNYKGKAEELTHEAHDKAKAFFDLAKTDVELVGFFTNREGDGGSFVHMGQTTHIHLISNDHRHMGHLESIQLAPGAKLLLPRTP
jgi:acetolactate decarboxylase